MIICPVGSRRRSGRRRLMPLIITACDTFPLSFPLSELRMGLYCSAMDTFSVALLGESTRRLLFDMDMLLPPLSSMSLNLKPSGGAHSNFGTLLNAFSICEAGAQ